MRSFNHKPDNRRQVYLALASQIEGHLRDAYAKRHDEDNETQSSLAEKLGVDRSAVHRRLTGRVNMTIETLADMVWALRHCIKVEIFDPDESRTNHRYVKPIGPNSKYIEEAKMIVPASSAAAELDPHSIQVPWVVPSMQQAHQGYRQPIGENSTAIIEARR